VSSKENLVEQIKKGKSQIGLIFEGSFKNPEFTLVYADTVSRKNVKLAEASINKFAQTLRGDVQNNMFQIDFLRTKGMPIPLNKNTVPIFIVFEVIVLGFMLISIMIFQEKQERTILAYRVTPSGTFAYIISKSLLFLFSSLIYGGIIILFTVGMKINFGLLFLIISLGSLLMTLVGLFVGIFFNDISGWFLWGISILMINLIPMISYMNPTFSPLWVRIIPSYYILFSVREILFSTGKSGFILPVLLTLAAECIAMFFISFWGVKKKLMEESGYNV
jgi:ABC-type multidrug transport system permease subunit